MHLRMFKKYAGVHVCFLLFNYVSDVCAYVYTYICELRYVSMYVCIQPSM